MTDTMYKEMTIAHDKHIDSLAVSIEVLADNVEQSNTILNDSIKETNSKLDTVIEVMSKQNVLAERLDNMDLNIKEFSQRVNKRFNILEQNQNIEGCPMLRISNEKTEAVHMEVQVVKDIVEKHATVLQSSISSTAIRWVGFIILGYAVTFGSYMLVTMHDIDTKTETIRVQELSDRHNVERRVKELESRYEQYYRNSHNSIR